MTEQDGGPSREEAFYQAAIAFLKRYGFIIAVLAPFAVVSLLPVGTAAPLIVLLAYLGEAIVYAAVRRVRRGDPAGRGVRSAPGPGLQALYGLLAAVLIIGGIFGLGSAGESPPILAILALLLGIGLIAWVWHRVAQASGENSASFVARIAATMGRTGRFAAGELLVRAILVAVIAAAGWLISIVANAIGAP